MASIFLNPFRRTYLYMQRSAHERPEIFYSIVLGALGPVLVLTVPPVRKYFGYKPAEQPPTSYPLPNRKRDPELKGYDD